MFIELQLLKGHIHLMDLWLSPIIEVCLKLVQDTETSSLLEFS